MAQPPLFGVPGFVHYWEPTTAAYLYVVELANLGPNYPREDAVRHTWDGMLHHYFPRSAMPSFLFKWMREPSRGVEKGVSSKRLDIIAVKVAMSGTMSGLPPGPSGVPALDIERHYLWVGYKAPNRDVPFEWKDALLQTGRRLHVAHPNRDLFVIIGVGLKYLKLFWNGAATFVDAPSCTVLKDGAGEWPIDPRFRMPPGLIAGTPYLNQATGQIDTKRAVSLDFWTAGGSGGRPRNHQTCTDLELFFQDLRNMVNLQGNSQVYFLDKNGRSKWVFKLKTGASGEITRHKARYLAKDFEQKEGIG